MNLINHDQTSIIELFSTNNYFILSDFYEISTIQHHRNKYQEIIETTDNGHFISNINYNIELKYY